MDVAIAFAVRTNNRTCGPLLRAADICTEEEASPMDCHLGEVERRSSHSIGANGLNQEQSSKGNSQGFFRMTFDLFQVF